MDVCVELSLEAHNVEPDLLRIAFEVGGLEGPLAPKQEVVHRPEGPLCGRCLARLRRAKCVWVNLKERKMTEDEAKRNAVRLEELNASIGSARVRHSYSPKMRRVGPAEPRTWSLTSATWGTSAALTARDGFAAASVRPG
jgi:hypothetical protein